MESGVASRPFANLNSASFALQTATPYWTRQYTGTLRGRLPSRGGHGIGLSACSVSPFDRRGNHRERNYWIGRRRQTDKSGTPQNRRLPLGPQCPASSAKGRATSSRAIRLPDGLRSCVARISASFGPDHATLSCQAWNIANASITSAALSDAIVPSGRCLPSSNPTRVDQRR